MPSYVHETTNGDVFPSLSQQPPGRCELWYQFRPGGRTAAGVVAPPGRQTAYPAADDRYQVYLSSAFDKKVMII
jgi:hypothetical protein